MNLKSKRIDVSQSKGHREMSSDFRDFDLISNVLMHHLLSICESQNKIDPFQLESANHSQWFHLTVISVTSPINLTENHYTLIHHFSIYLWISEYNSSILVTISQWNVRIWSQSNQSHSHLKSNSSHISEKKQYGSSHVTYYYNSAAN